MYDRGAFCLFLTLAVISVGISTCYPCEKSHCTACTSNTYCTKCEPGYYGNTCQHDCSLCRNETCSKDGCTQGCKDGNYMPLNTFCVPCYSRCLTCNIIGHCDTCKTPGMWGTRCTINCSSGCANCSSATNCTTCLSDYNIFNNYSHIEHDTHIKYDTNNKYDTNIKYDTNSEYYPRIECIKCQDGCGICTSPSNCTTCANGYYKLKNDSCIQCPEGCDNCTSLCNCTTCANGYYKSENDSCIQCPEGCDNCTSPSNCTTCTSGYYKSGNICISNCIETCKLDQSCNITNGTCNGCKHGWSGNKCDKKCANGCTVCDQFNDTCLKCEDGKYGDQCNHNCSRNCKTLNGDFGATSCNKSSGACNHGCINGYTGVTCDQVDHNDVTNIPMSVVGSIFLLVIAGASVTYIVMRKRKRRQPRDNDVDMPTLRTAVASSSTNHESMEAEYLYATPNKVRTNMDVPLSEQASVSGNNNSQHLECHSTLYFDVDAPPRPCHPIKHSNIVAEGGELVLDPDVITSSTIGEYNSEDASIYYTNVAGLKRCRIPVDTLQDYVAKKTNDDIKDEFQKLPKDLSRPCSDALLPGNKAQNRYNRIYPYDVSRVKLTGGASDFINANYIDGYNQLKTYIASQGPTATTMDEYADFWRMVWQEKVEKIVMLTNLIEETKMKCEQYWPNAGTSHMYGDVTVMCLSEDVYAEHITKTFTVTQGTETRSLHHLHFTAWQDKGVPNDTTSLIEFRQKVKGIPVELGGPVVVHCSAGVGRTGTYLALDILTKEGIAEKSVDILGCVIGLRSQRVAMVQTWEQYSYLHKCVVHALTYDCEAIPADLFHLYVSNNLDKDTLYTQFKLINSTGDNMSEKESDAVNWNKTLHDKNRKRADVPGDRYRPKLYLRRIPGASDYINATFVNSFTTKNRYIVAQTPLPGTVVDFFNLVFQENCSCIVSMDADLSTYKNVGFFLPAIDQTLKHETFQIRCSSVEFAPQYILRKLTIQNHGVNWSEEKTVNHFQFTCWTKSMLVPNDPSSLLTYIQDVEKISLEFTDMGPILIHCLNGAEKSGLFCAVSVLIQKMGLEHEVSVVNTVRQIKARRRGAIPNKEQYIFCHQCVSAYLQMFDLYSNFSLQV